MLLILNDNNKLFYHKMYSNACLKRSLKITPKSVFNTNYRLMQVKSCAECSKGREHSAIFSTFIKLPFVFKTFVLSILVAAKDRFYCIVLILFNQWVLGVKPSW